MSHREWEGGEGIRRRLGTGLGSEEWWEWEWAGSDKWRMMVSQKYQSDQGEWRALGWGGKGRKRWYYCSTPTKGQHPHWLSVNPQLSGRLCASSRRVSMLRGVWVSAVEVLFNVETIILLKTIPVGGWRNKLELYIFGIWCISWVSYQGRWQRI